MRYEALYLLIRTLKANASAGNVISSAEERDPRDSEAAAAATALS